MSDTNTSPIIVNANPALDQLKSAARALLLVAGTYAVSKGWIPADAVGAIVTIVLIGGPILWAQIEVRMKKRQAVVIADAAPDSVAVVKP